MNTTWKSILNKTIVIAIVQLGLGAFLFFVYAFKGNKVTDFFVNVSASCFLLAFYGVFADYLLRRDVETAVQTKLRQSILELSELQNLASGLSGFKSVRNADSLKRIIEEANSELAIVGNRLQDVIHSSNMSQIKAKLSDPSFKVRVLVRAPQSTRQPEACFLVDSSLERDLEHTVKKFKDLYDTLVANDPNIGDRFTLKTYGFPIATSAVYNEQRVNISFYDCNHSDGAHVPAWTFDNTLARGVDDLYDYYKKHFMNSWMDSRSVSVFGNL